MYIVPTFQNTSADYVIEAELNNQVFRLQFTWNQRESVWYMHILDIDDNPVLLGVKLVPSYLMLQQYRAYADLPQGDFLLMDLEDSPETGLVTFDNFGKRYQLIFFSDEELN